MLWYIYIYGMNKVILENALQGSMTTYAKSSSIDDDS